MAGFRPLKVLAAPFEEKSPKGSFFGGTFEKNVTFFGKTYTNDIPLNGPDR